MAKEKVVGTCRLCLTPQVELQNSHIVPEFLYTRIYDVRGRFQVFTDPGDRPGLEQKGFREPLLCKECEVKFSLWEKYVKELLFDRAPAGIDCGDRMEYPGVDYAKFKLFQMSLIWRMGATSLERFSNVNMGGAHLECLRDMLDRSDPGEPYEYGCWLGAISSRIHELGQVMMAPIRVRKKVLDHTCYQALLGGVFWNFFVSSHMEKFPYPGLFISKQDVLGIWKEGMKASQAVDHRAEQIKRRNAAHLRSP
ncbi:MAG: hypothetical protein IPP83_15385 [Flavobacteriales bacterium]|nr:hypothetical protein [Flavobacteriales bacterium]